MDKIVFGSLDWSALFTKHDFFHKYRYYLQVIASTGNADLQLKWCVHIDALFMFAVDIGLQVWDCGVTDTTIGNEARVC